jgi:ribosomal protein S18 acetylase RimI-like enzyme
MKTDVRLGAVTARDLRASFRGEIYGDAATMTESWFRDHVARNDVDLARSPRWTVGGALAGAALLAFRGGRAWVGAFGVVPEFRGRRLAFRFLEQTLTFARESGAASIELEVLEHNHGAIRLYERGGFEQVDELVVWSREPRPANGRGADAGTSRHDDAALVDAIARVPSACWQREPRGVAAAAPFRTLLIGAPEAPDAYAFVRLRDGERATVLDAGARDAAAASALLAALDARVPAQLILLNEPPRGPLHGAFGAASGWREFARQRRMRAALG